MAYKKFSDFTIYDPPDLNDYLVGYRELGGEYRAKVSSVAELIQKFALSVPNTLYVNLSGNDSDYGSSDISAFRTIKRAMAKALQISRDINSEQWLLEQQMGWGTASNPVVVVVKGGEYVEDNPIYVPPNVSLVGDSLKGVTILPKNKFYDILWVNNQTYIENISFKDYYAPAYAITYPEFQYLNNAYTSNYPSTRITSATARANTFFGVNPFLYPATKVNKASLTNFAIDNGTSIFDPFRIAFLNRYYLNLLDNDVFYTDQERIELLDFWRTDYYNLTSSVQKPYITLPPYINSCSSKSKSLLPTFNIDGGGSIFIDGYKADGIESSMIINDFEQFNEGGGGIDITNNGFAAIMGLKSTCCNEAVHVENGASSTINNSTIFYGSSGLVAIGKSPRPILIGTLKQDLSGNINSLTITNLGSPTVTGRQEFAYNTIPFENLIFSVVDRNYIIVATGLNYLTATNSGTYFSVKSASPLRSASAPYKGYECDIILKDYYNFENDTSTQFLTYAPTPTGLNAGNNLPAGIVTNQGVDVLFYNRSSILASSQIFNSVGSGTVYLSAPPQYGGRSNESNETIEYDLGKIYYNSSDQNGKFKIGNNFKYDQDSLQLTTDTISSYNIVTTNLTAISSNLTTINSENANFINLTISNLLSAISANFLNLYVNALTSNFSYSNNSIINTLVVASFSALSANFDSTQITSSTGLDVTGNVSISGNLNVGGNINGNEFIYNSLESPTLTGIKQALDSLLYTPVGFSYANVLGSSTYVVEIGTSFISSATINWNSNKPNPTAITQYVLQLPNATWVTGNYTFSTYNDIDVYGTYFNTLPVSQTQVTTSWGITAQDWRGNKAISSTSISWRSKIYWGVTSNTTPSDSEIRNNAIHQQLALSRTDGGAKTVTPANQYYYIAYPQRFGLLPGTPTIRVNGANDDSDISRVNIASFINGSAGVDSYYVYRSNNLLTGTYTIQIVS